MSTITTVAFDLMGTVLNDPFREALEDAMQGVSVEQLRARRDPGIYPAFERGEIDEADYWKHFTEIGIEVEPERFHEVRRRETRFLDGMPELLDELESTVVRATASNYPVWIDELANGPLRGRFERVLASYHLGVRKPDECFYTRLLETLELEPDAVAFVDDRPVNVEAAEQLGIAAHVFVDAATLRSWLADLGVRLGP